MGWFKTNWWDTKAQENAKKKVEELEQKTKDFEEKVKKLQETLTSTTTWSYKETTLNPIDTNVWITVKAPPKHKLCKCGHYNFNHDMWENKCYHTSYKGIHFGKVKITPCKCQKFREKPAYREIPKGLI